MIPLAERMRPRTLEDYIGQDHLVGDDAVLRKAITSGQLPSFILWGPPGTGKTTLAKVISHELKVPFHTLSAINSGVKDIRSVIAKAKKNQFFDGPSPLLFIDEIHRFNKAQQDALLGVVEDGTVTLIGATTENPSFEVISALLSRTQVFVLNALEKESLIELLHKACEQDVYLKKKSFTFDSYDAILRFSGGDARKLYNILEIIFNGESKEEIIVTDDLVLRSIQQNMANYDQSGDQHYDMASALIKSIRGSDPNGAVYWLARMIHGGEDPKFIARRLIISAAEDIGLANPNALLMANNAFLAIEKIGLPEGRIILSQAVIYLANSAKSNSAYMAIDAALAHVKETGDLPIPLHLRNAPTRLMKSLNYGKGYEYAHSYEHNFSLQEYLPESISQTVFYNPGSNMNEIKMYKHLAHLWKGKYGYSNE